MKDAAEIALEKPRRAQTTRSIMRASMRRPLLDWCSAVWSNHPCLATEGEILPDQKILRRTASFYARVPASRSNVAVGRKETSMP